MNPNVSTYIPNEVQSNQSALDYTIFGNNALSLDGDSKERLEFLESNIIVLTVIKGDIESHTRRKYKLSEQENWRAPGLTISIFEIRGLPTYTLMEPEEKEVLMSILKGMKNLALDTDIYNDSAFSEDKGRALVKTAHSIPNIEQTYIGNDEQFKSQSMVNSNNVETTMQGYIPGSSMTNEHSNIIPFERRNNNYNYYNQAA